MTTRTKTSPDYDPAVEEMEGLVDILRKLVHQHLPEQGEVFDTLLVDFATFWAAGDPIRRVLQWAWRLLPASARNREAFFIAEVAARGACTATEARALIDLDYGGARDWRVRKALRRAAIQRAEQRQFDQGEDLLARLPASVWNNRTVRARELWNTARREAAAGRAAASALVNLVGVLDVAAPQQSASVAMVASRAMDDGACDAAERDEVVEFCERWGSVDTKRSE